MYDEQDRATEVQLRDARGELVSRALRKYDVAGRIVEEHQILDSPENLFPEDIRTKMIEESGLPADELMRELRAKITDLMSDQQGPDSISYRYDDQGRVVHTDRRVFNHQDENRYYLQQRRRRSIRNHAEHVSNPPRQHFQKPKLADHFFQMRSVASRGMYTPPTTERA